MYRKTGTVHVVVPAGEREAWWRLARRRHPIYDELFPPGGSPATALLPPVPLRCWRIATAPAISPIWGYAVCFPDLALCVRCYYATPLAQRAALFEHDRPEETDLEPDL